MAEMQPPSEPAAPLQPHRGVMVLVFGILGLIPCCLPIVFGILAWVFGSQDLKAMQQGRMDSSGKGLTQAGFILGIISVVEQVIVLIYNITVGFAMFNAISSGKFPMPPHP